MVAVGEGNDRLIAARRANEISGRRILESQEAAILELDGGCAWVADHRYLDERNDAQDQRDDGHDAHGDDHFLDLSYRRLDFLERGGSGGRGGGSDLDLGGGRGGGSDLDLDMRLLLRRTA